MNRGIELLNFQLFRCFFIIFGMGVDFWVAWWYYCSIALKGGYTEGGSLRRCEESVLFCPDVLHIRGKIFYAFSYEF